MTAPPITPSNEPLKPTEPQRGLGRVKMPNPGSLRFPLKAALPSSALKVSAWKSKRWQLGKGLHFVDQSGADRDEASESTCVKHGWMHVMMLTPIIRINARSLMRGAYQWMQQNDYWPGEEPTYYGTSVDAGAQFLLKVLKVITEYRWPRNMDEVLGRLCIPAKEGGGPLVGGADWYSGMSAPDSTGLVHPTGELWGGHCFDAIGHKAPTAKRSRRITFGNSHLGNFVFDMEDTAVEWLFFTQGGEFCAPTELAKAA